MKSKLKQKNTKSRASNKWFIILLISVVSLLIFKSYVDEPDCLSAGQSYGVGPDSPQCCIGTIGISAGGGVLGSSTCEYLFNIFFLKDG
jgi:hypothetical protein